MRSFGKRGQPFSQDDLLLIAARQNVRRFLNVALKLHSLRPLRSNLPFFVLRDQTEPLQLAQNGQRDIARDRHFHHQPLLLAIFRHEADPSGHRLFAACG